FSESDSFDDYNFMTELCDVRKAESELTRDTSKSLEKVASFLHQRGSHRLMPEFVADVGKTYMKLVRDFIASVPPEPEASMEALLVAAEQTLAEFKNDLEKGVASTDRDEVRRQFADIRTRVARA